MATTASVAIRRANAEAAIKAAVSALAEKHGVEVPETAPYPVRDVELRRVMDLETMAANLTAIADGSAKAKGSKAKAAPVEEEVAAAEVVEAEPETEQPKGKKTGK